MTIRKRGTRYYYDFMIRRQVQRGITRGPHEGTSGASRDKDQDENEHRLFAEMTGERGYLQPLVTVAIYAGPRRGELLKLRWANVDFDLNAITFKETKTNKDRSVPMEPIV